MLRLGLIDRNPLGDAAIASIGMIILALLAAALVALWIFVARAQARRESLDDPALDALRRRKLVVRRSRKPRGADAVEVAQLEPTGEPGSTAS